MRQRGVTRWRITAGRQSLPAIDAWDGTGTVDAGATEHSLDQLAKKAWATSRAVLAAAGAAIEHLSHPYASIRFHQAIVVP